MVSIRPHALPGGQWSLTDRIIAPCSEGKENQWTMAECRISLTAHPTNRLRRLCRQTIISDVGCREHALVSHPRNAEAGAAKGPPTDNTAPQGMSMSPNACKPPDTPVHEQMLGILVRNS